MHDGPSSCPRWGRFSSHLGKRHVQRRGRLSIGVHDRSHSLLKRSLQWPLCRVGGVSDDQEVDGQKIVEHLARELLNYFNGYHPPGVNYDDQPQHVKDLWQGAARVAMKALQTPSA